MKTEESYVENLQILLKCYIEPIRAYSKKNNQISNDDVSALFGNIDMILNLHATLAVELQKLKDVWPQRSNIGDVFKNFVPYLKLYTDYINNYNNSLTTLSNLRSSSNFGSFLEKLEKQPEVQRLQLNAYLILPVQRIPRYKLLFEDLLKHTLEENIDYPAITETVKSMRLMAEFINESKRKNENVQKLSEIQNTLTSLGEVILVKNYREYKREAYFFKYFYYEYC